MMSYNGQDRHLKFGTTPRLPEAIVDCEFVRMDCIEKDIEGVVSSLTGYPFFENIEYFNVATSVLFACFLVWISKARNTAQTDGSADRCTGKQLELLFCIGHDGLEVARRFHVRCYTSNTFADSAEFFRMVCVKRTSNGDVDIWKRTNVTWRCEWISLPVSVYDIRRTVK
ncbi:hypothetical protein Q1695_002320 [Nippostrongylus brasiliensis]|nr:hypothetical protein Q1695_002320 [Nippostrongylus brasiliensis]